MTSSQPFSTGIQDEANVANLFIQMGYFTRPHIQIFPQDSTQQVSDIDVFGIKFDRHLNRHTALVEVKKNTTKITDLFKLYGFKSYYGNQETYFISEKIPTNFMQIAKNLEIKTMSFKMLRHITKSEQKNVEEEFTIKDIAYTDQLLKTIRDNVDEELYWKYHYLWLERNPYVKFFHIQRLFSKTMGKTTVEINWFRKELFLEAFLSHLEMASDCIGLEDEKITQHIEDMFYEIGSSKEGKLKIKQGVDSLIETIKSITGTDENIPSIDVIPKYLQYLVQVVKITINQAPFANESLLLNDLIYRSNLHGKQTSIDSLSKTKLYTKELKIINDLILRILHEGPIQPDFNNFV